MANEYATKAELKKAMSAEDLEDEPLVELALEAASRAIDNWCGRRFWLDPEPVARYFTACGDTIWVDDIGSASGLVLAADQNTDGIFEDAWTLDTHFFLRPRNAAAEGRPWDEISRPSWGTKRWPCREESIRVTARWGWPTVPVPIKQATLLQASRLVKRKDAPLGDFALDADVAALISPYRVFVIA